MAVDRYGLSSSFGVRIGLSVLVLRGWYGLLLGGVVDRDGHDAHLEAHATFVPATPGDQRLGLEGGVESFVEALALLLGQEVGRVDRHPQRGATRGPAVDDLLDFDRGLGVDRQRRCAALVVGQEGVEVADELVDHGSLARAQADVDVQEAEPQLVQDLVGPFVDDLSVDDVDRFGQRLLGGGLLRLGGVGACCFGLLGCGVHVIPLVRGISD